MMVFLSKVAGQDSVKFIAYVVLAIVIVGLVLSFVMMGPTSKKTIARIMQDYEGKVLEVLNLKAKFRHTFITQDELIIQNNHKTFKVFKLSEVRYVKAGLNTNNNSFYFAAIDEQGKVMKGSMWGSSKAGEKLNGATVFHMPYKDAVEICNLVVKYAPHVVADLMQAK